MPPMRRSELADLSVLELVSRLVHADFVERTLRVELAEVRNENAALKYALATAMCGDVLNETTTCQQPRAHQGLHAWSTSDGHTIIRW